MRKNNKQWKKYLKGVETFLWIFHGIIVCASQKAKEEDKKRDDNRK